MKGWTAFRLALAALLGLPGLGCLPPQADYEMGFGTTEIVGTVQVGQSDPVSADAIIIVLKNHYKFIPVEQQGGNFPLGGPETSHSITHPTAHLQRVPPSGRFRIEMPADVVSVDIMFIAADHLTDTFHFARSLGLGRITYRATLREMADWRSHFYTYLEPQLQHLIVESRYQMADNEQQQLADWLDAQKARFDAQRRAAPPKAEAPEPGPPAAQ